MADVFISYSKKDRDVVHKLAAFLGDSGYEVWWDFEIIGGDSYRDRIMEELTKARSAIVVWTLDSAKSHFVREESDVAREAGKLIATRVESFDPRNIPLGFRELHAEVVTESDRIVRALKNLGVAPSLVRTPPPPPLPVDAGSSNADQMALAHWAFVKDSKDPADYYRFIEEFSDSKLAALARIQLNKLATESWQNLLGSENIPALQRFVEQFPDDARAADARRHVEVLLVREHEAESWSRIKDGSNIAEVEKHIASYPGGANALAARAKLQQLQRERDALEHWRAIAGATQPGPFEQFLATYPDSVHAEQARLRLQEIHRAREETDWNTVRNERHPAPLLRFLKAHPNGARAAEAVERVASLPRLVEQEAWAEVKDCNVPVVLQAFSAGLPQSPNVKAVRARLRTLGSEPAMRPVPSQPAPSPVTGVAAERPKRWKRVAFWLLLVVLMLALSGFTTWLLDRMTSQSGRFDVSYAAIWSALALGVAALALFLGGPKKMFPPSVATLKSREILFHAIGSVGILAWMCFTLAVAEANFRYFNSVANAHNGTSVINAFLMVGLAIIAFIAMRAKEWRWLRLVYYASVFAIGALSVVSFVSYMNGGIAFDYWATTAVEVFGGDALMFMGAFAFLRELNARSRAASPAAPASR